MKRFSLLLICILALINVKAQDEKKNTIKLNLFGLAAQSLSFQYERTLNNHLGVLVQFGFIIPHGLPASLFRLDTLAKNSSYTQVLSAKFTSGFQFTPELRYYFKGEGSKGFYAGAYFRYSGYSISASAIHRDNNTAPAVYYTYTGNLKCMNVGIILGLVDHWSTFWQQ